MKKFRVAYLQAPNQKEPFAAWLMSLDSSTRKRIFQRLLRLEDGNFGDCKQLDNELFEARFKFGAGYRIYFSKVNNIIILLINGGDKSTQKSDIKNAKELFKQWRLQNDQKI